MPTPPMTFTPSRLPRALLALCLLQACGGTREPADAPSEPSATPGPGPAHAPDVQSGKAGAMQPRWTMIDGVRDCTGTVLSNYACIPPSQPAGCSDKAWKELSALSGADALTPCALEPDILECTVPIPDEPTSRCFASERPAACTDEKWQRVKDVKLVYPCP